MLTRLGLFQFCKSFVVFFVYFSFSSGMKSQDITKYKRCVYNYVQLERPLGVGIVWLTLEKVEISMRLQKLTRLQEIMI